MARPRVINNDKRIIQVNIRLTEAENAKVIAHAQACGLSPANWIRHVVFAGKFPPMKLSTVEVALYQELRRIGVNINQVTHRINQGDFPNEYLVRQIEITVMLNKILMILSNDRQSDQG